MKFREFLLTVCLGLIGGWLIGAAIIHFEAPITVHAQSSLGQPFHCTVEVSTATTLTAVPGDCVAQVGRALNVTAVNFSTNAAGITADSFNTLKFGSGTTCGTGTTIFWTAFTPAATQAQSGEVLPVGTAIGLPRGNGICWINSTAGSKTLTIDGFVN